MVQSKIGLVLKDGQPVIKMTCVDSEEIVDTVFKMFAEKFGHVSTLCKVDVEYNRDGQKIFFISPVAPDDLAETCSKILEAQPRVSGNKFVRYESNGVQLTGDGLPMPTTDRIAE